MRERKWCKIFLIGKKLRLGNTCPRIQAMGHQMGRISRKVGRRMSSFAHLLLEQLRMGAKPDKRDCLLFGVDPNNQEIVLDVALHATDELAG